MATKLKTIVTRALAIREKAGFTTETITKKRYKMAYIPDAIKQAAKELKGTEKPKRTKRVVKTKGIKKKAAVSTAVKSKSRIVKTKQLARRKVKRTGTNSKAGIKVVRKKISVSVTTAVKDVLTLDKYSGLNAMSAGLLFSKFSKDDYIEISANDKFINVYSKLEDKNWLKEKSVEPKLRGHYVAFSLAERGTSFIKAVKARVSTLNGLKYGYDLFEK